MLFKICMYLMVLAAFGLGCWIVVDTVQLGHSLPQDIVRNRMIVVCGAWLVSLVFLMIWKNEVTRRSYQLSW